MALILHWVWKKIDRPGFGFRFWLNSLLIITLRRNSKSRELGAAIFPFKFNSTESTNKPVHPSWRHLALNLKIGRSFGSLLNSSYSLKKLTLRELLPFFPSNSTRPNFTTKPAHPRFSFDIFSLPPREDRFFFCGWQTHTYWSWNQGARQATEFLFVSTWRRRRISVTSIMNSQLQMLRTSGPSDHQAQQNQQLGNLVHTLGWSYAALWTLSHEQRSPQKPSLIQTSSFLHYQNPLKSTPSWFMSALLLKGNITTVILN